jgi:hypothetical protein
MMPAMSLSRNIAGNRLVLDDLGEVPSREDELI